MQAIVVTFDRLATRLIGCYGNEWIETPNLDRLAAGATAFDNNFTDSVGPNCGRAWLTGRHALNAAAESPDPVLGRMLRSSGVATELFSASDRSAIPWEAAGFDRLTNVSGIDGLDADPNDAPIARLVQAASQALREPMTATEKRLIWLHAPEPGLPPEGFATLYFEDFEERDMPMDDVPRENWDREIAVAAGSMSLVDHWIGELLTQVRAISPEQPTLVVITAARGRSWIEAFFAAAASPRAASPADLLRDQEIKCPLFLSVAGDDRFGDLSGLRCQHFVQSTDLLPTLLDWFGAPIDSGHFDGHSLLGEAVSNESLRRTVCFGDEDRNVGIRTGQWNCLTRLTRHDQPVPADVCVGDNEWPEQVQLFSKPEDIWDVTDLSTQQPEVCETLVRQLIVHPPGLTLPS